MHQRDTQTDEHAQRSGQASRASGGYDAVGIPMMVAQGLAGPNAVLNLQRSAGNATVARLLGNKRLPLQRDDGGGGGAPGGGAGVPGAAGGGAQPGAPSEVQQIWDQKGGDELVSDLDVALGDFEIWKKDPNRSGAGNLPGQGKVSAAIAAFDNRGAQLIQTDAWYASLAPVAKAKLAGDRLRLLREMDSLGGGSGSIVSATGIPPGVLFMFLDGQHLNLEHRYKVAMHHDAPTNPVFDGMKWVVEKLVTTVDITYANNVGADWAFTCSYQIVGMELKASIGVDASLEGQAGTAAGGAAKGAAGSLLGGAWELAKNMVSSELSQWEKPESEKESAKLVEGGLGVGLIKLELEKDGVEADKPEEYWAPADISGPIVVAQFCNVEASVNGSKHKYTGIDSLEFMDGGSMVGRLIFPSIGKAEAKQGLGAGLKVEFTPVAMSGGYASRVTG